MKRYPLRRPVPPKVPPEMIVLVSAEAMAGQPAYPPVRFVGTPDYDAPENIPSSIKDQSHELPPATGEKRT